MLPTLLFDSGLGREVDPEHTKKIIEQIQKSWQLRKLSHLNALFEES